jgi:MFS family permease
VSPTVLPQGPATYRDVLGVAEYRTLLAAQVGSGIGDQMAKIALAILVFDRTSSPLLAALAYAVGYLPWLVGGPVLSPLADRLPRREVMVGCDLGRAVLLGAMALPGLPLPVLFALLLTASLLAPPFEAARAATLPDVLHGDLYVVGSALAGISFQLVQVIGFAVGGAVVALLGARGTLGLDAATFVVSALVIQSGVRRRPAADPTGRPTLVQDATEGARVVFGDPLLRAVLMLAWVGAAFTIVPEGLAVTYADSVGGGSVTTGFLTASMPAGVVLGAVLIGRFVAPARRLRLIVPLAVLAMAPLVLTAVHPPAVVAGLLWAASGFGMAFQLPANAAFVAAVPAASRGRAFGLAQSGLQLWQGVAIAAGGFAARSIHVELVVAGAGVLGLACVGAIALRWPQLEVERAVGGGHEDAPAGIVPPAPTVSPDTVPDWSGPYQLRPAKRELVFRIRRRD